MTESGRVYVRAFVDGGPQIVRGSDIVWVRSSVPSTCGTPSEPVPTGDEGPVCPPPPDNSGLDLDLTCPASVERATQVSCTVTNTLGTLDGVSLTWRFTPDPVPFTPASAESFTGIEVIEGPPSSTPQWSGLLVHPGTVVVEGNLAGEPVVQSNAAAIAVTDRQTLPPGIFYEPLGINGAQYALPLPQPPQVNLNTGRNHKFPFLFPGDTPNEFFDGTWMLGQAQSGPNDGYYYVASSNFHALRSVSYNKWIDDPGAPYPFSSRPGETTWTFVNSQSGANASVVRNATTQHEIGTSGMDSHQTRLQEAANDFESCGNVQAVVERLTSTSFESLQNEIDRAKSTAFRAMFWASTHYYVYGHQPTNARVADWHMKGLRTALDPRGPQTDPDRPLPNQARCNVSNIN